MTVAVEIDIPTLIGIPAAEHAAGIRQQVFERQTDAFALEDVRQEPGGEGEFVTLAGQGLRFQLLERQQALEVVAAVNRPRVLDDPAVRHRIAWLRSLQDRRTGCRGEPSLAAATFSCSSSNRNRFVMSGRVAAGATFKSFERSRFAWQRSAIGIRGKNGVRVSVIRIGYLRLDLLQEVSLFECQAGLLFQQHR